MAVRGRGRGSGAHPRRVPVERSDAGVVEGEEESSDDGGVVVEDEVGGDGPVVVEEEEANDDGPVAEEDENVGGVAEQDQEAGGARGEQRRRATEAQETPATISIQGWIALDVHDSYCHSYRLHESGKNEQDRIDDAVRMYEAVEPFQFMHCWKILLNESKWNDKVLELNSNSAGTWGEGSSQANTAPTAVAEEGNENSIPARPAGRDSTKRKRVADASSSSTAVDVLQRIHDC
ncbi:uncharacterized protein LOC120701326 [Panicum virgatum]|uniref:uncharacterized protein LOC120701326 n=1 Tax=Panicum virgatum TaxID=38727 RepID=UPI0019D60E24|nr:uncharacterized protein LOC120701326 [Panicum virgatum]